MTVLQALGAGLVATPFLALFALAWHEAGLRVAIGIYLATAALFAITGAGTYLLTGTS